jgi:hypothetical protein
MCVGGCHTPATLRPGKYSVPIVREDGWAPGQVGTCADYLTSDGIRFPDRPARSDSLYRPTLQH